MYIYYVSIPDCFCTYTINNQLSEAIQQFIQTAIIHSASKKKTQKQKYFIDSTTSIYRQNEDEKNL